MSPVDWKTTVTAPQPLSVQTSHVDDAWVSESVSEKVPAVRVGVNDTSVAVSAGELLAGAAGFVFVVPVRDTVRVKLPELTVRAPA